MIKALYELKSGELRLDVQLVPCERLSSSRGLVYGLGVFETLAVRRGKIILENLHLKRIEKGAAALNTAYELNAIQSLLVQFLRSQSNSFHVLEGILKVSLYSGDQVKQDDGAYVVAARGYASSQTASFLMLEWVSINLDSMSSPVSIVGMDEPMQSWLPQFVGLKKTSAIEYVYWSSLAKANGFDQGILFDTAGCVLEGTMSNVVLLTNSNEIVTPALQYCGVHGILRQALLDAGTVVISDRITENDLIEAKRVYLINSVRGAQPVKLYHSRKTMTAPISRSWDLQLPDQQVMQFEQHVKHIMHVE